MIAQRTQNFLIDEKKTENPLASTFTAFQNNLSFTYYYLMLVKSHTPNCLSKEKRVVASPHCFKPNVATSLSVR